MRSDTRRNIQLLIDSVAVEIEQNPNGMSMQTAAARAGIGTASAYRYFSSLDDLVAAYVLQVFEGLRTFSRDLPLNGRPLFEGVLDQWIDEVLENGRAMAQVRSRVGYLNRLDHGDKVIARAREIWERPVAGLLSDMDVPPSALRHAMFLTNALTDPREIIDLRDTENFSVVEIRNLLTGALIGAIRGWADVTSASYKTTPQRSTR